MGEIIGLDYGAVRFVMELYNVEDKRYVFEQVLQCFKMERELAHELPNRIG